MDPEETLKTIRRLCKELAEEQKCRDEERDGARRAVIHGTICSLGIEIADAFAALDGWITRGGFLPQSWAPKKPIPTCDQVQENRSPMGFVLCGAETHTEMLWPGGAGWRPVCALHLEKAKVIAGHLGFELATRACGGQRDPSSGPTGEG